MPSSPPPAPPVWSAAFSEPHQLPAGGVRPQDQAAAQLVDRWLWTYAQTRDPQLRERIVLAYLGLADRVARRYLHSPGVTPDDLRQVARLALLTAVDRYDPARGPSFLPYAVACIVGELKRYLRDTTWAVRVPRPLKERAVAVSQAAEELAGRLGRAPTVQELAEELGASVEEAIEAIEAARTRCHGSLDQPVGSDGEGTLAELLADAGPAEEPEDLLVLPGLVRQLPERERQVVHLTYVEELTQRQIGARIGCSQMQVSRLLRRALERLRHQLLAGDEGPDAGAAVPVAAQPSQPPKPCVRAPQPSRTARRRPCVPVRPRRKGRPARPRATAGPCGQRHTRSPRRPAGSRAGGLGRQRDAHRCLPCHLVGARRRLPAGLVAQWGRHPRPGSERHVRGPPHYSGTFLVRRQRAAGCSSWSWPPMACRTWAASSLSRWSRHGPRHGRPAGSRRPGSPMTSGNACASPAAAGATAGRRSIPRPPSPAPTAARPTTSPDGPCRASTVDVAPKPASGQYHRDRREGGGDQAHGGGERPPPRHGTVMGPGIMIPGW